MKFTVDEPRTSRGTVYASSEHENGLLVVRTQEHGDFVLDRLKMAVAVGLADAIADGEDVGGQIIEHDLTLSGVRRIIHGHGYVPIREDRVTGEPTASLPVHEFLELVPAMSQQGMADAPA